jgi:hypothetical protein
MSEPKPRGPEFIRFDDYLVDRKSYSGRSGRIKGFNRTDEAIGKILGIKTIDPIILSGTLFTEYSAHGLSSPIIQACAAEIWTRLGGGKEHPLIVRRLFPDQKGVAMDGPRSGNNTSLRELTAAIGDFYRDYTERNYDVTKVAPEIMAHRVIDTGNPPLREEPFLPHPGGDVTPLGNHTYQIRATYGADESTQGFPHDTWIVKIDSDDSFSASATIDQKTKSSVPARDANYRQIEIPQGDQNEPSLREKGLIVSLAELAKNLEDQHGGHRLEFNGTVVNGMNTLVITEAAPFTIHNNSYEMLRPFGDKGNKIVLPLNLITSSEDIKALPSGELVITYLAPEMFQGNQLRKALTNLALTAKANNIPLVALVAGDIATQHAVRDLRDLDHIVWFTGKQRFEPGEEIRLFRKANGDYDWEREDPIVSQDRMQGRGVERIGGKAVGLEKLREHGFPTPPHFVLETSVFRRIIDDLGLCDDLERLNELSPTDTPEEIATFTDPIRNAILNLPVNHIPDLEEALAGLDTKLFSVRSSARLEDGKMSYAGIYKTRLNVTKEGLRSAILEVLASAVSPLAVKSALGMDIKPSEASIAVIVQKMIQGPATGTIFTREHLKHDPNVLRIEVARLGEQIVDGTVAEADVQLILVDKRTRKITSNEMPGSGPILDDNQIEELIAQGLAIETALHGSQDIEFAISGEEGEEGKIVFLQARPL